MSDLIASIAGNGTAEHIAATHYGAIPITGLSYDIAQSLVVIIIYSSLWLGALGWEVLLTMPFDYRLLKETNWRSPLSALHSIAYYLSRYATLTFITLYVHQVSTRTDECQRTLVTGTALFSLSVCAINLVFMLRSMAIWNMRTRVVVPLTISWLSIVGFAIAMTVNTKGRTLMGYCAWNSSNFYVIALFCAVIIFGLLNLYLTILRLNRRGWKSVAKGLLPQSKPNMDSEDVSVMLVQRTTAFYVIQLVLMIIVVSLYFSRAHLNYRMMNFIAFKAITSSMAGKIFRKSWRLTRYVDNNGGLNRPPSYYRHWAEDREEAGHLSAAALVGTRASSIIRRRKGGGGDDEVSLYVEGEFYATHDVKTLLGSRTPAQLIAERHAEAGEGSINEDREKGSETVLDMDFMGDSESGGRRENNGRSVATNSLTPLPAPLSRDRNSTKRRGKSTRSNRLLRPQTEPRNSAKRREELMQTSVALGKRPVTASSAPSPLHANALSDIDLQDELESDVHQEEDWQDPLTTPSKLYSSREDLNLTPSRSRLWLDSRAERARMEAAFVGSSVSVAGIFAPPSSEAGNSYAPSMSSSSRTQASRSAKRAILENASEAGERLYNQARLAANTDDMMMRSKSLSINGNAAVTTNQPRAGFVNNTLDTNKLTPMVISRASFLPSSPAIVSRPNTSKLDRRIFDVDVLRQSLQIVERPRTSHGAEEEEESSAPRPSFSLPGSPLRRGGEINSREVGEQQEVAREKRKIREEAAPVRPKTAPSRPSSEAVPQIIKSESSKVAEEDGTAAETNALDAFRQVIEEEASDRKRGIEDPGRPRTSRGGRLGAFGGQGADTDGVGGGGDVIGLGVHQDDGLLVDEPQRPTTSHGGSNPKPFGFQQLNYRPVSAIEAQYEKLAAYVDTNHDSSAREDDSLQRTESRCTMEHLV